MGVECPEVSPEIGSGVPELPFLFSIEAPQAGVGIDATGRKYQTIHSRQGKTAEETHGYFPLRSCFRFPFDVPDTGGAVIPIRVEIATGGELSIFIGRKSYRINFRFMPDEFRLFVSGKQSFAVVSCCR